MIWGLTDQQREDRAYLKRRDKTEKKARKAIKHVWYAWHPVLLCDGRWAWLCNVWREIHRVSFFGPFGLIVRWRAYYWEIRG